jgi:hypothetical protein
MEIRLTRSERLNIAPYADMALVGHNQHGFTIDFVALDAMSNDVMDGTVVARVKLPPSVIFQIASAIAENVDKYEQSFGPITPTRPEGT